MAVTIEDIGLMALNYLSSLSFGLFHNTYQSKALKPYSPEAQAKLLDEFYLSMDLGTVTLPTADGIDAYLQSRLRNVENFSKISAPNGKSITDKLNTSTLPGAAEVKAAIEDALKLTDGTHDAISQFKKDMDQMTTAINDPDSKYSPKHLVRYLKELKQNAQNSLSKQHTKEKENIETLFNDTAPNGFVAKLKANLGVDDDQVKGVKKQMLETLSTAHKKELDDFAKSMDEPINKIPELVKKEERRVAYMAMLWSNNTEMRKIIDELHKKNRRKAGSRGAVSIGQEGQAMHALFKGISIEDLPVLKTLCGTQIYKSGSTYSIDFPNRWFPTGYYHSSHNYVKQDMLCIAGAIRASGFDKITMSVSHDSPKLARKLAQAAYEACLDVGFDPKNISINVNGKKMSPNEIFKNQPSLISAAQQRSAAWKKAREEYANDNDEVGYDRFKKALRTGRLTDENAQEPPVDVIHSRSPIK